MSLKVNYYQENALSFKLKVFDKEKKRPFKKYKVAWKEKSKAKPQVYTAQYLDKCTQLRSTTGVTSLLTGAVQQVLSRGGFVTHHAHGGA